MSRLSVAVLAVGLAACGPSSSVSNIDRDARESTEQSVRGFGSVGGSVLTYFDVGNYPANPTPQAWDSDVKGMIAWYHLDPARVRAKLQAMRAAGQRRVAFVLWFIEPEPTSADIARAHYVIPRADFTLHPQHQANLVALLRDVDALGFDEVQLRFGQQGGAMPQCYQNPACYSASEPIENPHVDDAIAFNWAFMRHVVSVAEGSGVAVHRLYDFAPEYPGIRYMATAPVWNHFTTEIWRHYVTELRGQGIDATMSFNHADYAGTEASFRLFDAVGWPARLSIDLYFGIYGSLGTFADALVRHGKAGSPVFIQETYRNDPLTADELVRAAHDFNLDIPFVMQWPAPSGHPELMLADLAPYSEYLDLAHRAVPEPKPALGSITADSPTCTIPAGASACSATIRWTTTGVSNVEVRVEQSTFGGGASGSQVATWIPSQYVRFDLYGDGQYIGSTRVTGVPAGMVSSAPSGTVDVAPAQCTIPSGASTCGVSVTWSTANASQVVVKAGAQVLSTAAQGTQPVQVPAGTTTVELSAGGVVLATKVVTAIASTASGSGSISASPQQCTIAPGASTCSSTITWNTAGASDVRVKIDGSLFASGPSGAQVAPWISENPATFELWTDGALAGTVVVRGVKATSAGLITAAPATCRLTAAGTCSVTLSWNVPGAGSVQIRIGGQLFASTGPTGSQAAPWITQAPAVFEVWADGQKVDSITVQGFP